MASISRFAGPTIKGYAYQFDRTILELLNADLGTDVLVEHLEDIGVDSPAGETAIQCKYLTATTLTNSTLREPIEKMLLGYRDRMPGAKPIRFLLAIHCPATGKGYSEPKSVDDLKSILTYTQKGVKHRFHEAEKLSDTLLKDFLAAFKIQTGPSYEDQQAEVITRLSVACSCSAGEADLLHYSIALRTVIELAIEPDAEKRRIDRAAFLKAVDVKETLYNAWYLEIRGEDAIVRLVKEQLKARKLLQPNREKLVFLGPSYLVKPKDTAKAIRQITDEHYLLNKSLDDAIPPTFVIAGRAGDLNEVKRELIGSGFDFNDGYESIGFSASSFVSLPVINASAHTITRASFLARVASSESYKQCSSLTPEVAIAFGAESSEIFAGLPDVYHLPSISTSRLIEIIKKA